MEGCPFHVVTEAEDEIRKIMELHAAIAHAEDPGEWSGEDRQYLKTLMKSE